MKRHEHHVKKHDVDERANASPAPNALEEGLAAIYGEDREDLHVVSRGASAFSRWLPRVVLGLAVATAFAFTGFFLYQRFAERTAIEPLTMQFEVAPTLVSGERATLVLTYANPTSVPLASLEVDINLPTTFRPTASVPAPTDAEEMVWTLGAMPAHTDGKITLEGIWVAEVGSSSTLQALAAYKPANFNADFHDITSTAVTTSGSTAVVSLAGPETGSPGDVLTYTATIANNGAETLAGAELALTLPDGFYVTTSSPAIPAGGEATWTIGDMQAGFSQTYVVSGSFASDVIGAQSLSATLGVADALRVAKQAEATAFTDVAGSSLKLDMIINGGTGDVTVDPESTLRVSIRLQNTGDTGIDSVSALLDFQSAGTLPIAWSTSTLDGGRVTREGIVFDAGAIGALDPDERVLFNLVFPLISASSVTSSTFSVTLSATQDGVTVKTTPSTVRLNANAELTAEGRYYDADGAPLGNGPLPPTVGKATSYRVIWTLTNGIHSLEDVRVSATLPEYVAWDDFANADLGDVTFDEGSRTVTWSVVTVPADVGEVQTNFSITIVPTDDDVGTFVDLLSASTLRATDAETGAALEGGDEAITTELPDDELANGKGIVESRK